MFCLIAFNLLCIAYGHKDGDISNAIEYWEKFFDEEPVGELELFTHEGLDADRLLDDEDSEEAVGSDIFEEDDFDLFEALGMDPWTGESEDSEVAVGSSDYEEDVPYIMAHGVNHAVGKEWKGYPVEDHLFDPDRPENTVGDEDPLQSFFDAVDEKYGDITLEDVQMSPDQELPLGLEDLLSSELFHELSVGAKDKDVKETDDEKKEKADQDKEEKEQVQKMVKEEEEEEKMELANKLDSKEELNPTMHEDEELMLQFLKKVLSSCPYKVRVEFVKNFKTRWANTEKRSVMMQAVKNFRDTMKSYVDGVTNLSEQTKADLDAQRHEMTEKLMETERLQQERKEAEDDEAREEIKKKLS